MRLLARLRQQCDDGTMIYEYRSSSLKAYLMHRPLAWRTYIGLLACTTRLADRRQDSLILHALFVQLVVFRLLIADVLNPATAVIVAQGLSSRIVLAGLVDCGLSEGLI